MDSKSGTVVTATAFVRNFGAFARTAGAEPVHILNHGRPAWSLISTEYLESLKGGKAPSEDGHALEHLVDAIPVNIIITDASLRITRTNPAIRHVLQKTAEEIHHGPLADVLSDYGLLVQAADRVLSTGVPEEMDVDLVGPSQRTFRVRIERFGEGVALLGHETTPMHIAREKHARAAAYETLIDAMPGIARGTINGRGLIVHASRQLADLVQSSVERLEGMRLSSIFHSSSRMAVIEAVERLLSERERFTLDAELQADGLQSFSVSLTAIPSLTNRVNDSGVFLLSRA